ncbi:MAG: hypothetical protein PF542_05620 [Nanoarchaeota archaeon]|jgi:hypothetical protein|nr:hypothetical protein [Nanoarchaeota archaeon]
MNVEKSIHYFSALKELQEKERFYDFIEGKIELAKENLGCNCLGGTFNGVGEISKDTNLHPWDAAKILNSLVEVCAPSRGYIVVWAYSDGTPYHSAIIADENCTKAISRNGGNKVIEADIDIDELHNTYDNYSGFKGEVKYFIPSKLQKILESEAQQLK